MKACSICKNGFSEVLMSNRWVCFKCDELLFDIEIESEEGEAIKGSPTLKQPALTASANKIPGQK
jgi:hypothetical protein